MDVSCAFASAPATPDHIALAEQLGYRRAWCYDSPALYADVWVTLALAARTTSTIGLGPAVLVPSLRHPMVNAAAIATLCGLAPGRVAVAIGAGFTGRMALGQRGLRWRDVAEYVRVLRVLLQGEEVLWDGAVIKMLHPDGLAPGRPIDVPILIAGDGPRGQAVARELGDGIMAAALPPPRQADLPEWRAILLYGTVLGEGEPVTATRVIDAAGHGVAVGFHARYERGGAAAVDRVAGGRTWREAIELVPEARRHLAIHEDHLFAVTERDRPAVIEGSGLLTKQSFSGVAADLRARARALADGGVTELIYQPAGPDIPGELERFRAAVS